MPLASIFWGNARMNAAPLLDHAAIARACERLGVARLRIFGSAASGGFDPDQSDMDFFVDFLPEVHDLLGNYLALTDELEAIVGRKVDLVMSEAVENPYFAAQAFRSVQDVYAD
jgi:predicted nucleotidyltransferase